MKSLQQILDFYGETTGCNNWDGFCRECLQYPTTVVGKINELLSSFDIDTIHNKHYEWDKQVKVILDNLQVIVDERYKRKRLGLEHQVGEYNEYRYLIENFKF